MNPGAAGSIPVDHPLEVPNTARDGQGEGVMPKENTYGSELPFGPESSAQGVVEVAWSREPAGHVQVAAKLFNDDGSQAMTKDEADRRKLWSQGFYVDLDRDGINRLIRNLRRARDQAFGKDE